MGVSIKDINNPQDLKQLDMKDLPAIAQDIRNIIIDTVAKNGGHLGPPLGVVELTLALHYVFDTPKDKLCWDVGHQAYAHKILTGRRDQFHTLKQYGGISGYPNIDESEYDLFTVGHSSTSISQALGLATARDLNGGDEKVVAIVGDGALTAGMAFEAINNAGQMKKDLIVVLNDNEMSISKNVGAISEYLSRIITAPLYNKVRTEIRGLLNKLPQTIGERAIHTAGKLEESLKGLLVPGLLFEELGFFYVGPIDGHDLPALIHTFNSVKKLHGPILLHVLTKKGKGYEPAEKKPDVYHGTSAFDIKTGETVKGSGNLPYTKVFAQTVEELAEDNANVVALTAAMPSGVGLTGFAQKFPDRFFDVGIAEQHCVTFAGALARAGKIPFTAIYATFLQRATDQVIHDVCLQNAHVVFCLDRMSIVGEDGASHNGVFAIPLLRAFPGMAIMLPKDGEELRKMLRLSTRHCQPISICYPKDKIQDERFENYHHEPLEWGRGEVLHKGKDIAVLAWGPTVLMALNAYEALKEEGYNPTIVNMRFVKPLDRDLILDLVQNHHHLITVEDGVLAGGAGSAVLEFLEAEGVTDVSVKRIGLPDEFIEHGAREFILKQYGVSEDHIIQSVKSKLGQPQLVL